MMQTARTIKGDQTDGGAGRGLALGLQDRMVHGLQESSLGMEQGKGGSPHTPLPRRLSPHHPHHLDDEVSAPEVGDGPGQPCAAPHEAEEERALGAAEGLHGLPEPLHQGRRWLDALVRGHRLEQVQGDVRAAAHLWDTASGQWQGRRKGVGPGRRGTAAPQVVLLTAPAEWEGTGVPWSPAHIP